MIRNASIAVANEMLQLAKFLTLGEQKLPKVQEQKTQKANEGRGRKA